LEIVNREIFSLATNLSGGELPIFNVTILGLISAIFFIREGDENFGTSLKQMIFLLQIFANRNEEN